MSWQQSFLETFGTGGLGGMSFRTWMKSLSDNNYSIDRAYLLRALMTTGSALQNSFYRRIEDLRFGQQIENSEIKSPVFVLGLWRSGTTHLHNLLTQDPRFAFANTYQVFFPHTFLTTESWNAKLLDFLLPARRVQDNVKLGADQPQEDDFAVCGMTAMSFMMSIAFPRRAAEYSRFITMQNTTAAEREIWQNAFIHFLKKLTLKYDRPLVLKSPSHTAHVRELLQLFPDAKFVLIHRDPHEVFSSSLHCFHKVFDMWALQELGDYDIVSSTIRNYKEVTEKYFAERALIPDGNLIEIPFSQLEESPLATMRTIYDTLSLPEFGAVEATITDYVASLRSYRKNTHASLAPELQYRLAHEWHAYYANWGYDDDRHIDRAA